MYLNKHEFIEKWLVTPTLRENNILPNLSGRGVTVIRARDAANAQFQHGRSTSKIAFEELFKGYGLVCRSRAEGCTALELKTVYPKPYQQRPCNAMFLFLGLKEMRLVEIIGKGGSRNPFRAVICLL